MTNLYERIVLKKTDDIVLLSIATSTLFSIYYILKLSTLVTLPAAL